MKQATTDQFNIREHNLSQILKLIREHDSISRASLVRSTHLSATSVSAIVAELLESSFVMEVGEGKSSGGRRPIILRFNPEAKYSIGVDLGASHISIVITNLAGEVKEIHSQKYNTTDDPQGTLKLIVSQINQLFDAVGKDISDFLGIGLTVPAPLEGDDLDQLSPVILPKWDAISLVSELQKHFDLPVYVDNDANGGAIAEKWWGAGRGVSNLVYIKLGVGVGSGLIVNDQVFRGTGGTAGEIGHTAIDPNGPACRCGNLGCMESYVGVPALMDTVRSKFEQYPDSDLQESEVSIDTIVAGVHDLDPLALEVVREAGRYLGISIANLLNLVNPEIIVLGGDLIQAGSIFLDQVKTTAFNRSISKVADETSIITSELGDDVIPIGAATLVILNAFLPMNIRETLNINNRR